MKKRITKIWSVGLVVMMLASLLVMAAPVSAAAQPLQWNAEDIPTTANQILAPGSDINDIAVGADGKTIYAAAKVYEAVTATITTDFSGSSDGDDEVFEVEYTDQDGATSTVYLSITENATEGDTFELELEAGDTGVGDITDVADNTTDATAGVFELSGDVTGYGLATWEQDTTTFTDGALAGSIVYKSTNGGSTWIKILTSAGGIAPIGADFVSVAPDDNNLVAIADNTALKIYISTNGGNKWNTLRFDLLTDPDAPDDINDIDMSAAAPTSYLAVAGVDAGAAGVVWVYDLGTGGGWARTDSGAYEGVVAALAVKFSPGFASDQVLTAVTTDGTDTLFEMLDLSTPLAPVPNWNAAAAFTNYPVPIYETEEATYAAIALAPDYLASDEIQRVAFVSLMGITDNGIYRLTNTNVKAIKTPDFDFHSLAYDGTTLVAGSGGAGDGRNTVWRSTDPLTTEPTFYPTASTKGPGAYVASADVNIEFAGTNVVAGTMGVDSAFAVSTDSGKSFNDIALIDTSIVAMEDVAVAADGSKVYMLTSNGNDYLSVWRYASGWQRVLTLDNNGYIVRLAPANADVVYVAKYNDATKSVYYSKDGGVSKWYNRTGPGPGFLADLAAQDDNVAYAATGTSVFKTANGGFTWNAGPPADTKLGDDVYSLNCLGENKVLAGSVAGRVSFTIDGNASWSLIPQAFGDGNVVVTADGLETGKNIYAGDAEGLYRWTIGQDSTAPWTGFDAVPPPPAPITGEITGIALQGPILYASTSTGAASSVYRTMAPFLPAPPPPPRPAPPLRHGICYYQSF